MHEQEQDNNTNPSDQNSAAPPRPMVSSARIVYCNQCGCQLDGLRIGEPCPNCGVPVGSAAQTGGKASGKAIAALVLGICSFVGCMLYGLPGIVCAILAIVFAKQVRRGVESGDMHASSLGMANAGRICGIVGLCLSIAYMVLAIGWMVFVFTWMVPQQQQQMQQFQKNQPTQWPQTYPPTTPAQPAPLLVPDVDEPDTESTNP